MTDLAELGLLGNMVGLAMTGGVAFLYLMVIFMVHLERSLTPLGQREPYSLLVYLSRCSFGFLIVACFLFFATRFVKLVWAL